MTRVCVRCNEEKSLELFVGDSRLPSGYRKYCKECKNSSFRDRYGKSKELRNNINEYQSEYRRNSPERLHIVYAFGITSDVFAKMLERQDGKCAICLRNFTDSLKPCIDHDHGCCPNRRKTCGLCTRGLLCVPCNGKLGVIEDADFMVSAQDYLNGWAK